MAVFFNRKKKEKLVSKVETSNKLSWATSAVCYGVGAVVGFAVVPAYAGIMAASFVPASSLPLIGSALTESAKVQAMTYAYNIAMSCAPVVTTVASKAVESSVLTLSNALKTEPREELESSENAELDNTQSLAAAAA